MTFSLARFVITENAYFFRIRKAITKKAIEQVIATASINKKGHFLYKEIREVQPYGGLNFSISSVVFKHESSPSFLTPGTELETKYGYLILLEFNGYLILSKRGTVDFMDFLEPYIVEIDYNTLSKFKLTPSTQYKKLGVSNLDTSKSSMRRATYEAEDVKNALSTISTGNKIVSSLKIKNLNGLTSIAIGTSRVNDLGNKVDIKEFCMWCSKVCTQLAAFKSASNYLDNFAEPLVYTKEIGKLKPVSILFNFSTILDDYEAGLISEVYYDNSGTRRIIDLKLIIDNHDLCLDVTFDKNSSKYIIVNRFDSSLILKKGKNSISISGSKLKNIYIEYNNGDVGNLLGGVNKHSLFTVSFQNIDIRYTSRTLFKDNKLLGNIDYFLKSIETSVALKPAISEKGNITSISSSFDNTSIFGIIESSISSEQYLLCDDLGDEWADYIGFTTGKVIRFYHAKSSIKKYSASAFHDLVSQAIKNIGNFDFNKDLTAKQSKISSLYSGCNIKRLRKGNAVSCFKDLKDTYNSPNIIKEIVLVIDFLNKIDLENELKKLKSGKPKNQTVQILWLLSTLIGSCQERAINVRIITN
jgi:hypothetical protein